MKPKKGELLSAFSEGNITKIMTLVADIPVSAKKTIPTIAKDLKKSRKRYTPLHIAIKFGNFHLCKLLIEDGVSLKGEFENGLHPLSLALVYHHLDIAELLIESGADLKMQDNNVPKTYPLFWAIREKNSRHIVEKILTSGFPVDTPVSVLPHKNSTKKDQMRAIFCAVIEHNFEAVEVLIRHGAKINEPNSFGETLLIVAVQNKFHEIVKLLLKNGAIIENERAESPSPLSYAISNGDVEMVVLLLDFKADIDAIWFERKCYPPLVLATSSLKHDIVSVLLCRGANIEGKHPDKNETALHAVSSFLGIDNQVFFVCMGDTRPIQVQIAKLLINKGADVNAKDRNGKTPLDGAIMRQNTELCKLLLQGGADVTGSGWVVEYGAASNRFRHIACDSTFKCPELFKLCLERGGDYNNRDEYGLTPYHYALAKQSTQIIKYFWQHNCPYDQLELIPGTMKSVLQYKPDPALKNVLDIQKEFMEAVQRNDFEAVVSALKKGAEPKGCTIKLPSTLHHVAASGNYKIAKLLLENGIPVNRINRKGKTSLCVALENNHWEVCMLLLQFGACYSYYHPAMGKLPKDLAKGFNKTGSLYKKIISAFKQVKRGDGCIITSLQQLFGQGDIEMVKALMNCVNSNGQTLMAVALSLGHVEIAQELMDLRVMIL